MPPRLLLVSNGHGEDAIAAALVEPLRARGYELEALPIVGEGGAYRARGVEVIGPTRAMPSGGFVYGRPAALAGDLASGLVGLTLGQIRVVRQTRGRYAGVVAVGDVVVLAFAWLSRAPYVLVGCAKSDHYLNGKPGAYLWHERGLVRHARCRGVYPRDGVTTRNLVAAGVDAHDLGNPMMDGLEPRGVALPDGPGGPTLLLLPGSRPDEAKRNFARLAAAAAAVHASAPGLPPRWLAALAPGLPLEAYEAEGWTSEQAALTHPNGARIHLLERAFADAAHACDLALAMAGTATEQVVGLGKPVVSLPGRGPQFTPAFAEAQTRLLGPSVTLASGNVAAAVWGLLADEGRLAAIATNGRARMGPPGASERIAAEIARIWPHANFTPD